MFNTLTFNLNLIPHCTLIGIIIINITSTMCPCSLRLCTPHLSWVEDSLLEGHCRYCWKRRSKAWPMVLMTSWASPSEHSKMWHADEGQSFNEHAGYETPLERSEWKNTYLFCWQGPLLHRQHNPLCPITYYYSIYLHCFYWWVLTNFKHM